MCKHKVLSSAHPNQLGRELNGGDHAMQIQQSPPVARQTTQMCQGNSSLPSYIRDETTEALAWWLCLSSQETGSTIHGTRRLQTPDVP